MVDGELVPKEADIAVTTPPTDAIPLAFRACAKFFEGCMMVRSPGRLDE